MMAMYFNFNVEVTILFQGWHVTSAWELALSCIVMFIVAVSFESLSVLRHLTITKEVKRAEKICTTKSTAQTEEKTEKEAILKKPHTHMGICSSAHALLTILHLLQVILAYALMLTFMTYNGWLCLSILLGATVGYLIFGWKTYEPHFKTT
ncbi:high affinity copper uptake protein 1-like [Saccoglossus kowalevskii]|uniref:Copper transport protein n=1 Tax=Saccoglossus kowalevskii TaxID=10224 RepID=A0ABM0GST5_SACKO|nr:PREDICTED: high affinity copper uptake protein 1-like [Saccoglossus kowalevskii]